VVRVLPEIIGAAVVLVNNVLVHRALPPPADTALNVASATSLTALALGTGCSAADLGLDRVHLVRGLRIGSVAAACCATCIGIAAALPATRKFFIDLRFRDMSRKETLYHASLRIPVATALAEEIMFRSALHALFARRHSLRTTLTWTSLIFGLWHILPTLDTFDRNHASSLKANRARTRPLAAVGITGATAVAGLLFSYLRLRSGNVSASVLPHAAINVTGFMVAKVLVDRTGTPSTAGVQSTGW
jgi:uncharacterized protein